MRRWSDGTLVQVPYTPPEVKKPTVRNGYYCVETGESFPDGNSAARFAGVSAKQVYNSVSRGHKAGEYHWKRIKEWAIV